MKKVFIIILSVILLFCLSACDPTYYYFDYNELTETVDRIELIRYDNSNAKEYLTVKEERLLSFDFEKMEILQILPEEDEEDFLLSLAGEEVVFLVGGRYMDSPQGLCVRLVYENGDFEIFTADKEENSAKHSYAGSFFENGEVKRFIGCTLGTSELIKEYFPDYEG